MRQREAKHGERRVVQQPPGAVADEAQVYFANGNNEWPVVKSAAPNNPALKSLGSFKSETLPISSIGKGQVAAQRLLDRVGYR